MKKIIYSSPHVLTLMGLGCAVQALMAKNISDEYIFTFFFMMVL